MSDNKILLKYKEKIDSLKQEEVRLQERYTQAKKQLKAVSGCTTVSEAQKMVKANNKKIAQLDAQIKKGLKRLQEFIDNYED